MNLLTKERVIWLIIVIILLTALANGLIWFNRNFALMAVPRGKEANVKVCLDNKVACSLIYESKDEIK